MIMAGRGRRLTDGGKDSTSAGVLESSVGLSNNLSILVKNIHEIKVNNNNASLFSKIKDSIKEIFKTKEIMRNALSALHSKALSDAEFGEKLIRALEVVSNFEVDGALLRNELLSFIQSDFQNKEDLFQSNHEKFNNAVLLLGYVYNRIRVCGKPITVLGVALLEYCDLLIKGDETEFKTLIKQIFLNGENLSEIKKFELLVYDLRRILTNENLSSTSKCRILLAIDFMSNGWKPLSGIIKNFYVSNLEEEYTDLESLIQISNDKDLILDSSNVKNKNNSSERKKTDSSPYKGKNFKGDLSKNFSDITLKSDKGIKERVKSPEKNNKKDDWKFSESKVGFGHDDRFEKEENFYGIQKPREHKPENQRKNFNNIKVKKKGSENFKTDSDGTTKSPSNLNEEET